MDTLNQSRTVAAQLYAAAMLLVIANTTVAAVRYVDVNSANPTPPYTNWAAAATNIQDAVDAAVAGDEIVVTNGTYAPVVVDRSLMLRSINGPQFTTIDAHRSGRCLYLTNLASISGFTLTNGNATQGGGLWCESTNAVASNCVIAGNSAYYGTGGGACQGTLNNCTLSGNYAYAPIRGGGGSALGGGAAGCTLNDCTLTGNWARGDYIGAGGGAADSTLNNCTLTGNSATGDLFPDINGLGGGAANCTLNNCIVYFNTAVQGANCYSSTLNYCCTTPQPTNGIGNITNAPLFVDLASGNLRLESNSPCINAGNNSYVTTATDLDGNPRIVGGTVDIGAYEFQAVVRYVDVRSASPTPPYTDWTTAATNIQDAVDAAVAGDEIVVTNGIYARGGRAVDGTMTNRVAVDKPLALRSINGPQFTIIQGYQLPGATTGDGAIRCVYLTNGASLAGFTLTNGATRSRYNSLTNREWTGGGLWCESTSTVVVSNCVLTGNSAEDGGGAYGGTLNDCNLNGNSAFNGGGASGAILNHCTLSDNSASARDASGGGAFGCTLNGCTLVGNSAVDPTFHLENAEGGGGGASESTLNNCILSGNRAWPQGGGSMNSTMYNCRLEANSAGFYGGGASGGTLNNCTLTGNSAFEGGGVSAYIVKYQRIVEYSPVTLNNCIVYFNQGTDGSNFSSSWTMNYCCSTPQPTNGVGNITNAPLFVDPASGNLRLQSNSPCINASGNAFTPAGPDLDGNPRIVGGTVDVGAYEFQSPTSIISYAWLQQYGLPTDGSVDLADPDGDGMNNWQEWICGTDPTNALSALRLLAPARAGSELLLRWESVADRTYFLERSTGASSAFTPLATGISGQPGTTSYTDTNALGSGPFFYRVGVGN